MVMAPMVKPLPPSSCCSPASGSARAAMPRAIAPATGQKAASMLPNQKRSTPATTSPPTPENATRPASRHRCCCGKSAAERDGGDDAAEDEREGEPADADAGGVAVGQRHEVGDAHRACRGGAHASARSRSGCRRSRSTRRSPPRRPGRRVRPRGRRRRRGPRSPRARSSSVSKRSTSYAAGAAASSAVCDLRTVDGGVADQADRQVAGAALERGEDEQREQHHQDRAQARGQCPRGGPAAVASAVRPGLGGGGACRGLRHRVPHRRSGGIASAYLEDFPPVMLGESTRRRRARGATRRPVRADAARRRTAIVPRGATAVRRARQRRRARGGRRRGRGGDRDALPQLRLAGGAGRRGRAGDPRGRRCRRGRGLGASMGCPEAAWEAYVRRLVDLDLGALTSALRRPCRRRAVGPVREAQDRTLARVDALLAAARTSGSGARRPQRPGAGGRDRHRHPAPARGGATGRARPPGAPGGHSARRATT